jgi:hypothetical protein
LICVAAAYAIKKKKLCHYKNKEVRLRAPAPRPPLFANIL